LVATVPCSTIYVAASGKVYRLDADGTQLGTIGVPCPAAGECPADGLVDPCGLGANAGYLLVLDAVVNYAGNILDSIAHNSTRFRVVKAYSLEDPGGTYVGDLGGPVGLLMNPSYVAAAPGPADPVVVLDTRPSLLPPDMIMGSGWSQTFVQFAATDAAAA